MPLPTMTSPLGTVMPPGAGGPPMRPPATPEGMAASAAARGAQNLGQRDAYNAWVGLAAQRFDQIGTPEAANMAAQIRANPYSAQALVDSMGGFQQAERGMRSRAALAHAATMTDPAAATRSLFEAGLPAEAAQYGQMMLGFLNVQAREREANARLAAAGGAGALSTDKLRKNDMIDMARAHVMEAEARGMTISDMRKEAASPQERNIFEDPKASQWDPSWKYTIELARQKKYGEDAMFEFFSKQLAPPGAGREPAAPLAANGAADTSKMQPGTPYLWRGMKIISNDEGLVRPID